MSLAANSVGREFDPDQAFVAQDIAANPNFKTWMRDGEVNKF